MLAVITCHTKKKIEVIKIEKEQTKLSLFMSVLITCEEYTTGLADYLN